MLTSAEISRYRRQVTLPELGTEGQERLRASSVLVVGAGGLGSPAALYLVAAGVGKLGVVDDDDVEESNLHRQILHGTPDVGRRKSASAADALHRLNPHVDIAAHSERLTRDTADEMIASYDIVVDGSDNYATRYAVNDACASVGKRWIYGSVERYSGQVSVFGAPAGPCYRCIFPIAPAPGSTPSCEEIGVLGAVPGVIGSLQAVEALKCLTGIGEPLTGRLLQIDFLAGQTRTVRFERNPECPACGDAARSVPGEVAASEPLDIPPHEAARQLRAKNTPQLLDVRERWEWSIARLDNAVLIPMSELESKVDALSRSAPIIVYCHHGTRSRVAAEWLRSKGLRAQSLDGGIDRWSRELDTSVRRY
jgi:molybdopterin/thiamine biosynthesis adenylyltransferase/rhodanese-related sulfurtransferase